MNHFDAGRLVSDWWIEKVCASYGGRPTVLRRWIRTGDGWDYDDRLEPSDADVAQALASNREPP